MIKDLTHLPIGAGLGKNAAFDLQAANLELFDKGLRECQMEDAYFEFTVFCGVVGDFGMDGAFILVGVVNDVAADGVG